MTYKDMERTELSAHFSGLLGQYQQEQRVLMDALRDDAVGVHEFEQLCDRQTARLQELKRVKIDLMNRRTQGGPAS